MTTEPQRKDKTTKNHLASLKDFPIQGMHCASCAGSIEKSLTRLDGVTSVNINYATGMGNVQFDRTATTAQEIVDRIDDIGFGVDTITISGSLEPLEGGTSTEPFAPKDSSITRLDGVLATDYDAEENTLTVRGIKGTLTPGGLAGTLRAEGHRLVTSSQQQASEDQGKGFDEHLGIRLMVGVVLGIVELTLSMGPMLIGWPKLSPFTNIVTQWAVVTVIVFWSGKPFLEAFVASIRRRNPDMYTLIGMGTLTAYVWSLGTLLVSFSGYLLGSQASYTIPETVYFESAGLVIAFLLVGRYFEDKAKKQAHQGMEELLARRIPKARAKREGEWQEIPLEEVLVGDVIQVKPGEILPTDGTVASGTAVIDESIATGESIPVERKTGETVKGGTMNTTSTFTFEVTRTGNETFLAQLIRLLREAQSEKPEMQKLADKVASVFVPIVLALAAVSFLGWALATDGSLAKAVFHAVTVLVVACPCALGLATPLAIYVASEKAFKQGIFLRRGAALEVAAKVDVVIFDKTGTLTEGRPKLVSHFANGDVSPHDLLHIAASLESASEHPLSTAVVEAAREKDIELDEPQDFQALTGMGVKGKIGGNAYILGNVKLLEYQNVALPDGLEEKVHQEEEQGRTVFFLADDATVLGMLCLADTIKPAARRAIETLVQGNITPHLLSGDRPKTVKAIAEQLGIAHWNGSVLPDDKVAYVKKLHQEGKTVVMVGDGMNDAAALATAHVGIAMGAGSDLTQEAADVTLSQNNPEAVPELLHLARKTLRIIRQNLVWAFAYNIVLIPVAMGLGEIVAGVRFTPSMAAIAMSASSLTVVYNSLRIWGSSVGAAGESDGEE